jgi:flagellar biosynthesis protein FlhA
MPGMPAIPFIIFGLVLGTSSYMVRKGKKEVLALIPEENAAAEPSDEKVEQYLQVDPIEIEIGYGLISLVDEKSGGNLFHKISSTRKFIALEYGILIPPVRVRDNLQLNPNEYIIKIKGNIAALYEIYPDRFLAMNSVLTKEKLEGIPTKDPAFDMPAYWIAQNEKDRAELLEYTVVDCTSVLSTHLQETLKKNFDKILTRQAVRQLLENLKKEYPAVIEDINPDILPIGSIQKVLQNLLKEFIPVKDLVQILESLIDYSKVTKNIDVLTEYVRHAIGDTISNLFKDHNGIIHAAILDENIESIITRSLQNQKDSSLNLGLSGTVLRKLNGNIQLSIQKFKNLGYIPVIITSATIRPYFYRLINSSFTEVAVLSYSELPSNIEIEFIDKIEVTIAN